MKVFNMILPDDVLHLIREYSRPITRPDWRQLHIMPDHIYKAELKRHAVVYSSMMGTYLVRIKEIMMWID